MLEWCKVNIAEGKSCPSNGTSHCLPRAIAHAEGIDFDTAHNIVDSFSDLRHASRKYCPCKRTHHAQSKAALEFLGWTKVVPLRKGTVNTYIPPRGTFIVFTRGHAATVIDGVLYDSWDSRRKRIQEYYVKE